ncbi:MAG TPA: hypothetical protein VJ934_09445 [Desulfomicrobiaceae bacterium]|nr:hypothetical protein [Desulfomicrobiaceae bacterium]
MDLRMLLTCVRDDAAPVNPVFLAPGFAYPAEFLVDLAVPAPGFLYPEPDLVEPGLEYPEEEDEDLAGFEDPNIPPPLRVPQTDRLGPEDRKTFLEENERDLNLERASPSCTDMGGTNPVSTSVSTVMTINIFFRI